MLSILADLPAPEPTQFWQFFLCSACVVGFFYYASGIWKNMRPNPPLSEQYATRAEQGELKSRIGKLEADTTDSFRRLAQEQSERDKQLYNKINATREDVASLKTAVERSDTTIGKIDYRLDQLFQTNSRRP